ncbi:MAG: M14 family metallopeptidase [Pseudomonadota bacterium]
MVDLSVSIGLTIRDSLPGGLLDCNAQDLHGVLGGPTLIELPGEREASLFVSILMHGNEDVGLGAIQRVLKARAGRPLPRALTLLIGNVEAAAKGRRRTDDQPDYNRVWPGAESEADTPEAQIMAQVHRRIIDRSAFAAIDLHNNTGRNPHYGVVCTSNPSVLALASFFSQRVVRFRGLPGTQTASLTGHIPAMTAECGRPGSAENEAAAARFVDQVLDLAELPAEPHANAPLDLFHTLGVVRVKPEVSFGFGESEAEMCLDPHLDRFNFTSLAAGTAIGRSSHAMPLCVIDEQGRDVATEFFAVDQGRLRLSKEVTPAMLTVDTRVVRQDCLGYLMEKLDHP